MTKEIIAEAKNAVKGNWWRIFGTAMLMVAVVLISALLCFIPFLGSIAYILIAMYLGFGFNYYCFNVSKGQGKASEIFYPLKDENLRIAVLKLTGIVLLFGLVFGLAVGILACIPFIGPILAIVLYVWMFMFVIYYSVVSFILYENPSMKVMDALKLSKELTTGHRWTWFWMQLAIYLKPILLYICGLIIALVVGLLGESAASLSAGIIFISYAVYAIWIFILMPVISMLAPVYYEKVKALKSDKVIVTDDINVQPF